MAETFYWLFPSNFKEKASTIFYDTAFQYIAETKQPYTMTEPNFY